MPIDNEGILSPYEPLPDAVFEQPVGNGEIVVVSVHTIGQVAISNSWIKGGGQWQRLIEDEALSAGADPTKRAFTEVLRLRQWRLYCLKTLIACFGLARKINQKIREQESFR
jgi:hypothetical protein